MKNLFVAADRQEILTRLDRLRPDTPRRWGKMSTVQMIVHAGDQLRSALGELHLKPIPHVARYNPLRWLIIYVLPIPRNVPTAPELVMPQAGEWDAECARLRATIDRFATRGEAAQWVPHAIFGPMSGRDWGVLAWKHLDHHFRQFGS
jgi:hypothetical protein